MSKESKLELSIIIISFNTADILADCLKSLQDLKGKINFETIIVDNNSTDDSVQRIKKFNDDLNITLIQNNKNIGFGAANNQAMELAKGNNLLLLNSDTVINSEAIIQTLDLLKKNKKTGVVSCKLVGKNGGVQSNGGYFPNFVNVFFWMTFLDDINLFYKLIKPYHHNPNFENDSLQEKDWVTGAYFLLKKDIFETVGGFDEDFFMYAEEMEYCYRIKKKNWKIYYQPNVQIKHLGGASSTSENALVSEFKGIVKFFEKHKNSKVILRFILKFGILLRIVIFAILGKTKRSKIYAKAFKVV